MLTGSVSAAARLINVTQPAVSRILAHAELQLGFPLFHRIKGKLVPTTEAQTRTRTSSACSPSSMMCSAWPTASRATGVRVSCTSSACWR